MRISISMIAYILGRQADRQTGRRTDRQADSHKRQAHSLKGRQTVTSHKKACKKVDRQTENQNPKTQNPNGGTVEKSPTTPTPIWYSR